MRVLVTGGTGYLGSAIVRSLVARRHQVVVFARSASQALAAGQHPGAEAFDGDVRNGAAVARAVQGADAVCHSAALVSMWRRQPREFDEVNVGGLENVLHAVREARTPRLVYTSSFLALPPAGSAAPNGWNDYQRTKVAAAERAARAVEAGIPLVRLVPGVIYGPGRATEGNLVGGQIADHLRGRLPGVIGGERHWSFAWIEDVADAHAAALERGSPGTIYHLGGPNERQMRVFEIVRDVTGLKLPRRIPTPVAAALAAAEELRAALTGRPPLLTTGTVEILDRDWTLSSEAAVDALGYRLMPLETGVRRVVGALDGRWAGPAEAVSPGGA